MLDRVIDTRRVPRLRLLRIDAFGRGGRIVATWTHDGPCSRYTLLVDGRGRLDVTGSKDRDLAHATYVVAGEGKQLTTHRLAAGPGILASPPWSNEEVIYLPTESATGSVAVQRIDLAGDGVAADVAECFLMRARTASGAAWMAALVAIAGACGDGDGTPAAAVGAGGSTSSDGGASSAAGPVAVSASASTGGTTSTGTGGANPDDPYGCLQGPAPARPSSVPEGYRPWACWSQKPQCMLWIPEDPASMVDPLEWEACAPGSPGGDGCRRMERPWWTDGFGIGATFPAVPELDLRGPRPLLRLARESRDDANLGAWWIEWDVYELDGPARFAMRRPVVPGVECGFQDYDLTEGFWVLAATGQDEAPIGETPLNGAIVIRLEDQTISLPYRDDGPLDASWRAGAGGLLRDTGGAV